MARLLVACLATATATFGPSLATASAAGVPCPPLTKFNPLNFPEQPTIGSNFLPLIPGQQRVLTGLSHVSGALLPHTVTFTVTDLTKVIAGVRSVVIHDVDISNGILAEQELAFFAEDRFGNVWNVGEYPEEYAPDGTLRGAPSTWLAGIDGAVPGIHMPLPVPEPGGAPYLQGSVPKIGFLDCASTFSAGTTDCVPAGCFKGTVITDETSPLDPSGGSQRKTYAPGIGIVQVGFVDDPQAEALVLTAAKKLSEAEMAPIRDATLAQDKRGFEINDSYRRGTPIEPIVRPTPAALPAGAGFDQPGVLSPFTHRPSRGRVSLALFRAARHVARGRAPVLVRCGAPANRITIRPGLCHGRLELYLGGTRVGTRAFSVRGGTQRAVPVRLAGPALQALRRAGRLTLTARTRAARAGTRKVVVRTSLTFASR